MSTKNNAYVLKPNKSSDGGTSSDRLLTIQDVVEITGFGRDTASSFIKESGRAITMHRRIYILESSFWAYLKELEGKKGVA